MQEQKKKLIYNIFWVDAVFFYFFVADAKQSKDNSTYHHYVIIKFDGYFVLKLLVRLLKRI